MGTTPEIYTGITWEIHLNLYMGITPELDLIYMGMGIAWEKAV